MKTTVSNIRFQNCDVYIGRNSNEEIGKYGNPIIINDKCLVCGKIHKTAGSTLCCYEKYLLFRIENDKKFKKDVLKLHGKTLGCWCKPRPCHGDILAQYIDSHFKEDDT